MSPASRRWASRRILGGELVPVDGLTALVKSPGVPGEVAQVAAARAAGVPVWSEVELAARMLPNPIAGVTGTNGKTTTTHLVGAMLRAGGLDCEVAGNVGRPLTELAGRIGAGAWIACELSSFQLEDIDRLRCRVAVVLNLTPDHLDRHGDMDSYVRSKLRILENQAAGDTAVLNGDDPLLRAAALPGAGERVWFTAADRGSIDWEHARLRGEHNLENALAAAAAARAAGVTAAAIDAALRAFDPPPHRLETVASAGGVEWVNDSKATNPDATIKALTAFAAGLHLILGGSLKGASFDALGAGRGLGAGGVLLPDRRRRRCAGRRARRRRRAVPPLRDPGAGGAGRGRGGEARRDRAALTRLRELRPVPRLRAPRRPLPRARPAGAAQPGPGPERRP